MNRRGFIGTAVAGLLSLVLPKLPPKDFGTIMGKPVVVNPAMDAMGGLEAAPIVFDGMIIMAPLVHGELFPLVRGHRTLEECCRARGITV